MSAGEAQHQMNIRRHEENESIGLVKSFLHNFLKLLRDERAMLEMQNLIDKCENPISMDVLNRAIQHKTKHVRTGREMRLSA